MTGTIVCVRLIMAGLATCAIACSGGVESGDSAMPTDSGRDGDAAAPDTAPPDATSCDAGAGASVEAFQSAYLTARCGMFVECESYFGLDTLRATYQSHCHPAAPDPWVEVDAALAAGTVTFDAAAAVRCLEMLADSDCDALLFGLAGEACDGVWVPTVEPGGPCATHRECIDARCITDAECPGTCVAYGAAGDECTPTRHCGDDLLCTAGTCEEQGELGVGCASSLNCSSELVCQGGVCATRPAAGETCSTTSTSECAGSLVCSATTSTCVVGGMGGDSCADTPCAVGMRCDRATDTCVRSVLPGGACTLDAECPSRFFCDSDVCTPLPAVGEPCATAPACAEGACESGTCRLVLEGETCDTGSTLEVFRLCADGLDCGLGRVCTPRVPEGGACDLSTRCLESHECRGGVCHPRCSPTCG
jgi:hypothetical protein